MEVLEGESENINLYKEYLFQMGEMNNWIKVKEKLPNENETVWITNGKGWVALGCLAYVEDGYLWGISNGEIYPKDGKIMTEVDLEEDLDVKFWHSVPDIPKI